MADPDQGRLVLRASDWIRYSRRRHRPLLPAQCPVEGRRHDRADEYTNDPVIFIHGVHRPDPVLRDPGTEQGGRRRTDARIVFPASREKLQAGSSGITHFAAPALFRNWRNNGQISILARYGLSANGPKRICAGWLVDHVTGRVSVRSDLIARAHDAALPDALLINVLRDLLSQV